MTENNIQDEVPLKHIDDTPDEKEKYALEANEDAPLNADEEAAEGGAVEGSFQKWYRTNKPKIRFFCVILFIIVLIVLIAILISILVNTGPYFPDNLPTNIDKRKSLLEFYPHGGDNDTSSDDRYFIRFQKDSNETWKPLANELDELLSTYYKLNRGLASQFIGSPCVSRNNYGYDSGKPCIFIQFNKVKNWEPDIYTFDEVHTDIKHDLKLPQEILSTYTESLVYVTCQGDTAADREMAGKISYHPRSGYFVSNFPYTGEAFYAPPMLAINLENPVRSSVISITCRIWAKNVDHENKSQVPKGSVSFILLIE